MQQNSTGMIPSSHSRDVRKTAESKGLFLLSLIALWVSWPGSQLWAGPALDKAIEGPLLFSSPPLPWHPCTLLAFPLRDAEKWIPNLAGLHSGLGCVRREIGETCPRSVIWKFGAKPRNLCFNYSPGDSEEQPSLRNTGIVQWARTLESDKAEFKFNFCHCGLGLFLSFSESQSAHL